MAAAGLLEDNDQQDFVEKHLWALECVAKSTSIHPALFGSHALPLYLGHPGGLPAPRCKGVLGEVKWSAHATAAPTFNVTLRVNNKVVSRVICGRGDRVDVAYEGVPLAHGELPNFCVPPGTVCSVPIVAAGDRRRRREHVQLAVNVGMHEITGNHGAPLLLRCTAILHGHRKEPFLYQVFGQPEDPFILPV
ncbi:hypothetical protein PVAP13_5NG519500 [Panicum virgatum]|uniref:Uncharacterized protein n=1 Tax=Panicum virgatum TaxID=38727 RepID=A0A8T0S4M1_PANVG|nr:hypothetical protein PVAP13_5NG519500 [Panicum virgatum]